MTQGLTDFVQQYQVLSLDEISDFTSQFKKKSLCKGDYLLQSGSVCKELVFVQSGCLRMYYLSNDVEVSVWFAFPNSLATELASFISQEPAGFFVQAIEDCQLLYISKATLTTFYQTYPALNEVMRTIWEEVMVNMIYRFTALQQESAEQRYLDLLKEPEYLQHIPQKYLASFIGVTPSSLSRIRKKLLKRAKLSQDNLWVINWLYIWG